MEAAEKKLCPECGHELSKHRRGLGCTAACGEPWAAMLTCRCKQEPRNGR